MQRVGIIGGTGYTGIELLRLLLGHPQLTISAIAARGAVGERVDRRLPQLRGVCDLSFISPDSSELYDCDLVFFATPNATAMHHAGEFLARGVKVIDLAADFRFSDPELWSRWYGEPHAVPELLQEAVYGLPEINRDPIRRARLVANPGCYPTSVQLGFLPLLEAGIVRLDSLIADTKSGVSGAGRSPSLGNLLAETSENVQAYKVDGHRHQPEICQVLTAIAGQAVTVSFVPHLMPMIRGIHATLYAELCEAADLQRLYEQRYAGEPFVDVMPAGSHPQTRSVRGSNVCRIAVHQPHPQRVVILSVIDNLVKGAAGAAVQNCNIMLGLPEESGLVHIALIP